MSQMFERIFCHSSHLFNIHINSQALTFMKRRRRCL
uniref:Uncharacterized protein n=1 Tax=Anguilla anguilla TaxID=7936 RepID=A0A0E9UAC5_ANGAN